ncbi:MAG: hypothetical protein LBB36_02095 [Fibromonadaceae bacterium]|jgi:hypothetical protein|nr:hypothetical protein [Fibromonadaceae bacterium]
MRNRYLRATLLFLGIAGIVAYSVFPNEKEVECLESETNFYPYGDSASGMAYIKLEPFAFRCSLLNENGNCGMGFSFGETRRNSKNWNLMDSLVLELQSSPDLRELVVQILTYDPDYTKAGDRSTMKPFIKEVELNPGKKRYSIALEHFYVPDYWFVQQNAKNSHNAKRFFAVMGMDIYAGWKNPANTMLELKVSRACAEGFSNTPFVILVIYLGILIASAIAARVGN